MNSSEYMVNTIIAAASVTGHLSSRLTIKVKGY